MGYYQFIGFTICDSRFKIHHDAGVEDDILSLNRLLKFVLNSAASLNQ